MTHLPRIEALKIIFYPSFCQGLGGYTPGDSTVFGIKNTALAQNVNGDATQYGLLLNEVITKNRSFYDRQ